MGLGTGVADGSATPSGPPLPPLSSLEIWSQSKWSDPLRTGPSDGTLEDQWGQLRDSVDVLALAPDDELLAETMALQSELLQQMLVNRRWGLGPG